MYQRLWLCVMLPSFIFSKLRVASSSSVGIASKRSFTSLAFASNNQQRHLRRHLLQKQNAIEPITNRQIHRTTSLNLNRILFDTSEIDEGSASASSSTDDMECLATVTFSKDDYRTIHVAKILGLQNGDTIRAGAVRSPTTTMAEAEADSNDQQQLLAGLITDEATVTWLPEGKIKKAQPTKNGDPPGSLQLSIPCPPKTSLWNERNGTKSTIHEEEEEDSSIDDRTSDVPSVSLLLALPRPLQLGRILPMVSQLGIDQLVLTNAKKVPKDYFGSHIFRKPEVLRNLLVEGLAQSGDVRLPNVTVTKRLKIFMEDELDTLFPPGEVARVIAHPQRKGVSEVVRMSNIKFPGDGPRRVLVAVG